MMKLFLALLCATLLYAQADFSEMSTEELIALIGYVSPSEQEAFYSELSKRQAQMSEEQKELYDTDKQRRDHASE